MRVLIKDAIESLILLLDEIDGDDSLEDDDCEIGHVETPALPTMSAFKSKTGFRMFTHFSVGMMAVGSYLVAN